MTKLTAQMIQNNVDDLLIEAICDKESGKYAGFIYIARLGHMSYTLISTNPGYDNEQEATEAMNMVIKEVCTLKL